MLKATDISTYTVAQLRQHQAAVMNTANLYYALQHTEEKREHIEQVISNLTGRQTHLPATDAERATTPDYRYTGNVTDGYIESVVALQALEEAEPGKAFNAAAEVLRIQLRHTAEHDLGEEDHRTPLCPRSLVGRRCDALLGARCDCRNDHASLWFKDGRPYAYLFQPDALDWPQLKRLMHMCERLGLEMSINQNYAFHYPGEVVGVLLRRAGTAAEEHAAFEKAAAQRARRGVGSAW